jgi:hypothetical protein
MAVSASGTCGEGMTHDRVTIGDLMDGPEITLVNCIAIWRRILRAALEDHHNRSDADGGASR